MKIAVRRAEASDAIALSRAFEGTPWAQPLSHFENLICQQREGNRVVFVALLSGEIAGYASLVWRPEYSPFRDTSTPEIQEVTVSPQFRRRGVATRLLDEAEQHALSNSKVVGIAFGLHPGYNAAQRLYVLRGYIPDGRGVYRAGRFPQEGEVVALDDELVLHLVKQL